MKNENLYKTFPLYRHDMTRIVKLVREKLSLENELKIDVVDVMENRLQNIVKGFNYEIVDVKNMYGVEAEYNVLENKLYVREDTYDYAIERHPHYRLTFGHEFSHIFCHTSVRLQKIEKGMDLPNEYKPEWQANVFGGEFLAPSYLIGKRSVEEIEQDFNVSNTYAKIQKREHNRNLIMLGWYK